MSGSKVVKVVFSEQMLDRVTEAATQRDQTVSEFIRSAIRSQFEEHDTRSKGADHALDLIRAIATGAHNAAAPVQSASPFEPKVSE